MGNTVGKCCVAGEGTVRVMTAEGEVEEFEWPVSASEVMERHPGYLVLDTSRLESKEYKGTDVVLDEVRFVRADMALQPGRLYVLYTIRTTPEPAKSSVDDAAGPGPGSVQSAVPPSELRTVAPQPEVTGTCIHSSSDSKKVTPDKNSSVPSQSPTEQFEQFTPTFTRRRSSTVIASDILHSFQVKEEAAVDAPAVPEPKEEKPRDHGWCPSLSSIPESPASSLRELESSAAAKQICKTPPRNSTNINKLVKQAILHKHPSSFWR